MDVDEFHRRTVDERVRLVWEHGSFLCLRHAKRCSVMLYHMGGFFAEVWYLPQENRIDSICGFTGKACLEPYLEMIDLQGLMG
jgi:hypothetical protein